MIGGMTTMVLLVTALSPRVRTGTPMRTAATGHACFGQ